MIRPASQEPELVFLLPPSAGRMLAQENSPHVGVPRTQNTRAWGWQGPIAENTMG